MPPHVYPVSFVARTPCLRRPDGNEGPRPKNPSPRLPSRTISSPILRWSSCALWKTPLSPPARPWARATEARRPGCDGDHASVMDSVPMDGTIVIGEGERDEAPMLYIGEKVGKQMAARIPKSTSRSIRWRARTCAPSVCRALSLCWRPRSAEACCTRLTATWRRWSSALVPRHRRSRGTGHPQPGGHRQGAGT